MICAVAGMGSSSQTLLPTGFDGGGWEALLLSSGGSVFGEVVELVVVEDGADVVLERMESWAKL